jgi:hypothetical protein
MKLDNIIREAAKHVDHEYFLGNDTFAHDFGLERKDDYASETLTIVLDKDIEVTEIDIYEYIGSDDGESLMNELIEEHSRGNDYDGEYGNNVYKEDDKWHIDIYYTSWN